MPTKHPAPSDEYALADSAHELQRAAGHVQKHAAAADPLAALGITLAHVEGTLDRLSVGMLQMANSGVEWSAAQGSSADEDALAPEASSSADEDALAPEARALCFHLRAVADALRAPRDACTSSRLWTRRLLHAYSPPEDASTPAPVGS